MRIIFWPGPGRDSSSLENVYLGLEAGSQVEVDAANAEPVVGLLIKVEAAADAERPTCVEMDLSVVQGLAERKGELDAMLRQTRL